MCDGRSARGAGELLDRIGAGSTSALPPIQPCLNADSWAGMSCCRPGADPRIIADWEDRHGYRLPAGLRAWLMLSNGLFGTGPLIHPISAIGPMIPFARVPDLIVQPESWFELGNPNLQTVCIDLGYRLPDGGCPIFTSGDDASQSPPRIIARCFEEWFLELLRHGGREYWFDPEFIDFGDPWQTHRYYVANPPLSGPACGCLPIALNSCCARGPMSAKSPATLVCRVPKSS